jgi:hypothetical protein
MISSWLCFPQKMVTSVNKWILLISFSRNLRGTNLTHLSPNLSAIMSSVILAQKFVHTYMNGQIRPHFFPVNYGRKGDTSNPLQLAKKLFFQCFQSARFSQGCQMVYFQTKNPNFGKFKRPSHWKEWVYFWPFGIFNGHSGYVITIWYILCSFGKFLRF